MESDQALSLRLLLLDTAGESLSAAAALGENVLASVVAAEPRQHASRVSAVLTQAMQQADWRPRDVQAIAVAAGPGSYTGIRIGVAAAKGFAQALGIPLIAASSLRALAAAAAEQLGEVGSFWALIDARRMEAFSAVFERPLSQPLAAALWPEQALVLSAEALTFLGSLPQPLVAVGSAAPKLTQLAHWGQGYLAHVQLTTATAEARHLLPEALARFRAGHFADLAHFDPAYLKPVNIGRGGTFDPAAPDPRLLA